MKTFSDLMIPHSLCGIKVGNMSMQLLFLRLEIALNCAFIAILLPSDGQSSLIEFFKEENYVGFVGEQFLSADSAGECFNISEPLFKSVKTERCLMFYSEPDCIVYDRYQFVVQSFKVVKNEPALDTVLKEYIRPLEARSFHLCNQGKGGGTQVDVELYSLPSLRGDIVYTSRSVCGCKNLPLSIYHGWGNVASIDNHGNSIEIFSDEYCKGEQLQIPAGRNILSMFTTDKIDYKIRSFRPVSSHDCIKLKATITKFYFANSTQNHLPQNVKFATSTKVRNNGAVKITQEYVLSERVVDTLDITVAKAFTRIRNVDISEKLETEAEAGLPFVGTTKLELKYGVNYAFQRTDSESESDRVVNTTERIVSTKQSVDIPRCKECTLTSFLRKMENFPFKYTAFARVSGTGAGVPLTAAEVRQNLPDGAEYIRDFDGNTVEIMATGEIKADHGIGAFIDVECHPIPGCGGENASYFNNIEKYQIPVPIN